MQIQTPAQLTQVPPKPTCNPNALFVGADCQDRINIYNQALQQRQREEIQLYVNRQKELASSQASAPLQQQIAELNKLVTDQQGQLKKLQEQSQADSAAAQTAAQSASVAAMQQSHDAHVAGLEQGVGVSLILFVVVVGIRRLARNFTVTKKAQAASA